MVSRYKTVRYKTVVASMTLADALPALAHPQYDKVRELDALRVKLAEQYEAQDAALLLEIRRILKHDGTGIWTRYLSARDLPGSSTYARINRAEGRQVPIVRFAPGAAHDYTRRIGYRSKGELGEGWDIVSEADALRAHGFEEDAQALEAQEAQP